MNWVESAALNETIEILGTFVITLCTWFFLSRTGHSVSGKKRYRLAMMLLYWGGFAGITYGMKDDSYISLVLPVYMIVMTMTAGWCLYNRSRIYSFYYFLFPVTIAGAQIWINYMVLGYMSARWGTFIFDYYLRAVRPR